jgi:hypothetical protein
MNLQKDIFHEHRRSGEENLLDAMVYRAVLDYWTTSKLSPEEKRTAIDFCEGDDIVDFTEMLGMDGKEMKERVLAIKKGEMPMPFTNKQVKREVT